METVRSRQRPIKRTKKAARTELREALSGTVLQMALLQRRVGARLGLKEIDLECFNIIYTEGPLSPTALARRAGMHPATMTGVLDRLERGNWVVRERDPKDRRAAQVRALQDRSREMFDLLVGMDKSMAKIMDDFTADELLLVADFLRRTNAAGKTAADGLAPGHS